MKAHLNDPPHSVAVRARTAGGGLTSTVPDLGGRELNT